jgi:hypothetical protein
MASLKSCPPDDDSVVVLNPDALPPRDPSEVPVAFSWVVLDEVTVYAASAWEDWLVRDSEETLTS